MRAGLDGTQQLNAKLTANVSVTHDPCGLRHGPHMTSTESGQYLVMPTWLPSPSQPAANPSWPMVDLLGGAVMVTGGAVTIDPVTGRMLQAARRGSPRNAGDRV